MGKYNQSVAFTQHQLLLLRTTTAILDNQVRQCIKMSQNFDLLKAHFKINIGQEQTFHCVVCGKPFGNVKRRSAHMNAHKDRGKEKKTIKKVCKRKKEKEIKIEQEVKKDESTGQNVQVETGELIQDSYYDGADFIDLYEDKNFANVLNLEFMD